MSMDSNDKRPQQSWLGTFSNAFAGILVALKSEKNMKSHLFCSIIVLLVSYYFSITKMEWIFILFAIGGMFALELVNTAIERVVDLVTAEYHPLAKQAKDMAAGAVLIYAVLSIAIGIFIFFPYIQRF
ncbi:diacylglycerol kinase family protein [Neobacillus drentensis]|uniref:diacylglycerol kinase family protein n=1 Tax=Neobacillus drentensis TaxID=220684 RepID=UPI002FFF2041